MQTPSLSVVEGYTEIREAFELWLEALQAQRVSPRTIQNYRECVGKFVAFLETFTNSLDAVQPTHLRKWLIQRQQRAVSANTLFNSYRNPRAFWNWCIREGLTENNPFAKVPPPKPPARVKPALSPDQVERLLNACNGSDWLQRRDRALILLLLDTGMRIHEAHQLTVADATHECLLIKGKGDKQRLVFLSPETRLTLKRYLRACPHHLTPSDPLWQGAKGALTLHGLKNAIKAIGRRAGITPLGAHIFRRTFATWSLRSGIDLEHLRQLMGHSDYTVLRQYLALVESDLKHAHQQHTPVNTLLHRKRR